MAVPIQDFTGRVHVLRPRFSTYGYLPKQPARYAVACRAKWPRTDITLCCSLASLCRAEWNYVVGDNGLLALRSDYVLVILIAPSYWGKKGMVLYNA